MKNRKKLFCIFLSVILVLTGCGATNNNQITNLDKKYIADNDATLQATESQKSDKVVGNAKESSVPAKTIEPESSAKKNKRSADVEKKDAKATATVTPKVESKSSSFKKNDSAKKKSRKSAKKSTSSKNVLKDKSTSNNSANSNKSNLTLDNSSQSNTSDQNDTTNTSKKVCYLLIECKTILDNMDNLKSSKKDFVPSNGVILKKTEVEISSGDTAYDVLFKVCKDNNIQMDASYTPAYKAYYVKGIHQLYEFDCGDLSGWTYRVNGKSLNYGCSKYEVKSGDIIRWSFTCNAGKDIGA